VARAYQKRVYLAATFAMCDMQEQNGYSYALDVASQCILLPFRTGSTDLRKSFI
jgi:hypothetical protein